MRDNTLMNETAQTTALAAIQTERLAILAEIDAIETTRQRDGRLSDHDSDRLSALTSRKQRLGKESLRLQIQMHRAEQPRPRAQYWDDDARGGVIYE